MKKAVFLLLFILLAHGYPQSNWKQGKPVQHDLQLFHSMTVALLPTAETLQKGDVEFEVSHRFHTPVNSANSFFGLDGPANIRLALGYAVSNSLFLNVGRTNVFDNTEFQIRYKALQLKNDFFPVLMTLQGGVAYNSQVTQSISNNSKKYQYYGQVVVNTLIFQKVGLGIVPTYLQNAHIFCKEYQHSFTLGNYIQYYASERWSIFFEWNPTISGWRQYYNTVTIGFELETGGHFFKILLTNNDKVNSAQFHAGSDMDFLNGEWRIGFTITRLLR